MVDLPKYVWSRCCYSCNKSIIVPQICEENNPESDTVDICLCNYDCTATEDQIHDWETYVIGQRPGMFDCNEDFEDEAESEAALYAWAEADTNIKDSPRWRPLYGVCEHFSEDYV